MEREHKNVATRPEKVRPWKWKDTEGGKKTLE